MKQIRSELLIPSLLEWNFHAETVKQFVKNPRISPKKTCYFNEILNLSKTEGNLWSGWEISRILDRATKFKNLWKEIRKNGYNNELNPIKIKIKSNGIADLIDGHHRVAIVNYDDKCAQNYISCEIIERSSVWNEVVISGNNLYSDKQNFLYTKIDHPEFSDWKFASDPSYRSNIISRHIDVNDKVLDIGCNHGGVAFELAKLNKNITAVDNTKRYLDFANKLKTTIYNNLNITFVEADAWKLIETQRFDWILCLSVLHHIAKKGGKLKVKEHIEKLKCSCNKGCFIEMASGNEGQMIGSDMPMTQAELTDYIGLDWEPINMDNSNYTRTDRRWLWKFVK